MAHISELHIIEAVKEITVAMVSNSGRPATAENGEHVAAFMQKIYDKLKEFGTTDD